MRVNRGTVSPLHSTDSRDGGNSTMEYYGSDVHGSGDASCGRVASHRACIGSRHPPGGFLPRCFRPGLKAHLLIVSEPGASGNWTPRPSSRRQSHAHSAVMIYLVAAWDALQLIAGIKQVGTKQEGVTFGLFLVIFY